MRAPVEHSADFHSAIFSSPLPSLLPHQIMIILLGIRLNPDNSPPAKELFYCAMQGKLNRVTF